MERATAALGLTLLTLARSNSNGSSEYDYSQKGKNFGEIDARCNGYLQSPIRLETKTSVSPTESPQLILEGYAMNPAQVVVLNDGKTASYSFQYANDRNIVARGGPLHGNYVFAGLHFHWGTHSHRGAEHKVDRLTYAAMEMHLVFFNQRYGSFENAQNKTHGLAVLGVLFCRKLIRDPHYRWIDALNRVQNAPSTYTLPDPTAFNIKRLIGSRRRPYFSYQGSLTTPPCHETVTWIVQKKPLPITENQLNVFRSLRQTNGEPLVDNYRKLQHRNGRHVYLYQ
ncbi:carbonic anhydrase 2-like [Uranotaenia lowii]|uniref:carbonic anhydrase 2-like n=1 Tax=Uranotaenia lowii TaxID=190385 RepID=UPI00247B0B04|nr:carbonic anhydrase 2-like [Uranotaenia lowii]